MEELRKLFNEILTANLEKLIFGSPRKKSLPYKRITIRPVMLSDGLSFQMEYMQGTKAMHANIRPAEAADRCMEYISDEFKQLNAFTLKDGERREIQVLANDPARPRITENVSGSRAKISAEDILSHNRNKKYIIPDGKPCDFLIELGVMSPEGKVFQRSYSKFRQINRYLEIVADSLKDLETGEANKTFRVIDFGCGKAYLTFALYYYLKIRLGMNAEIVGLDLKQDVIDFCEHTARALNYDGLHFLHGDIADYKSDGADMVVTLHACDTATDFALRNAVLWHSRIILSVPCCQHELFKQIKNDIHMPMYKHGILKERFTEILTDGLRGLKLESKGYDVSMIEFTSLEHTARNIMIKAVLKDPKLCGKRAKEAEKEYETLCAEYGVHPTTSII